MYNTSYNAVVGNVNPFEHFASNYMILKGGVTSSLFVTEMEPIKLRAYLPKVLWGSPSIEDLKRLNLVRAYDLVYIVNAPQEVREELLREGYTLKYSRKNVAIYEIQFRHKTKLVN